MSVVCLHLISLDLAGMALYEISLGTQLSCGGLWWWWWKQANVGRTRRGRYYSKKSYFQSPSATLTWHTESFSLETLRVFHEANPPKYIANKCSVQWPSITKSDSPKHIIALNREKVNNAIYCIFYDKMLYLNQFTCFILFFLTRSCWSINWINVIEPLSDWTHPVFRINKCLCHTSTKIV